MLPLELQIWFSPVLFSGFIFLVKTWSDVEISLNVACFRGLCFLFLSFSFWGLLVEDLQSYIVLRWCFSVLVIQYDTNFIHIEIKPEHNLELCFRIKLRRWTFYPWNSLPNLSGIGQWGKLLLIQKWWRKNVFNCFYLTAACLNYYLFSDYTLDLFRNSA